MFNYNLSDKGFYITDAEDRLLFQSKNFAQQVKLLKATGNLTYSVIFKDKNTGKTYETEKPIEKCISWEKKEFYFPDRLSVIKRSLKVSDIPGLGVLERLFKASIQFGNPVVLT